MDEALESPPIFPREPREPQAWLALWLIFGLLAVLAIASTFLSDSPDNQSFNTEMTALESAFRMDSYVKNENLKTQLATIGESVNEARLKNPQAARISTVVQLATSSLADKRTVDFLREGKAQNKEFASLISLKGGDRSAFQRLSATFQPRDFADSYALGYAAKKSGSAQSVSDYFPITRWRIWAAVVAIVSAMTLVGLVVLGLWIWKRQSGSELPGSPLMPMSLLDADRLAMRCFLCMVVFIGLPVVLHFVLASLHPEVDSAITMTLAAIAMLLVIRKSVFGKQSSYSQIVGEKQPLSKLIVLGIAGACAALPLALILSIIGSVLFSFMPEPTHPAAENVSGYADALTLAMTFYSAMILAPFIEELVFRGMLLPALNRLRNSQVFAIAVSSLIFASIHPQGLPMWLALAAVGSVASVLVYETRSLIPAMVMHGVFNGALLSIGSLGT